jgi:hypothetical protein
MFKIKKRHQRSWEYYGDPNSVIFNRLHRRSDSLISVVAVGQVSSVTGHTELVNCIKAGTRKREPCIEDKTQEAVTEFVKWDKLLHDGYRVFPTDEAAGALTIHPRPARNGILRADLCLITYCR